MESQVMAESNDKITQNPFPSSPDLKAPIMSAIVTPLTSKKTRLASRSSEEVVKAKEKLEVVIKKDELEGLQTMLEEEQGKIVELQSACERVSNELKPMEQHLAEILAVHEVAETELSEAETELYHLRAKAVGTKATSDHINAYKQEIEVAKMKPAVFDHKIRIAALEEIIGKKQEQASEVKRALQDTRDAANKLESEVKLLKAEYEKEDLAWITKWESAEESPEEVEENGVAEIIIEDSPASDASDNTISSTVTVEQIETLVTGPNENEFELMKAKLEYAEKEILRQSKEIKILKTTKLEKETENDNISMSGISVHTENGTKAQPNVANLLKENQALKERIERLEPLFEVGYFTRARSVELGLKDARKSSGTPGRLMNEDLLSKGIEAHRGWNSKADACMFLTPGQENRRSHGEFLDLYGVNVNSVWDQRKFTHFQNMITWKLDMVTRFKFHKAAAFNEAYDKLFKAIMPNFKINNDIAIQSNVELREAYEILKKEHGAAKQVDEANFARLRNGQGSFNNATRPAGPPRAPANGKA